MFSYRNIQYIDRTTLRIFCNGTGTNYAEMYTFNRAHAMLQLAHWLAAYRKFPEEKEFRKFCMSSFLFNVKMMVFYKRGFR